MSLAKEKNVEIVLPVDFVVSSKFGEDGEIGTATKAEGIKAGYESVHSCCFSQFPDLAILAALWDWIADLNPSRRTGRRS